MWLANIPIRRKLMIVIMLTSGSVVLLTLIAFLAYEYFTFRRDTVRELSTLGSILATNSTAALAFDSPAEAGDILSALQAEPQIVSACLYDAEGKIFAIYPFGADASEVPAQSGDAGYHVAGRFLEGFQPVVQGNVHLGSLYLRSNMAVTRERFQLYFILAGVLATTCFVLAYFLSLRLQQSISRPILSLAKTAGIVSGRKDYAVRAVKESNDEIGLLTDAFNTMLSEIQAQNLALHSFNVKLEAMVAERTRELEMANKELESFSYSVSHDLRAPLRSVHGYVNIFSEEYATHLDDEAKRLMKIIQDNAKKMGQLIDDLLSFSRLGRKELMKAHISMTDLVSMVWDDINRGENDRDIQFTVSMMPVAYADSVTMRHVWVNLISNAVKYTRNKPRAIIEVGCHESERGAAYFVKDNGSGFDMKYYNKLFGVFQRLHSQEEFEGTGVGLAIVHRIISRHGGEVWAEAEPEQGATFFFTLAKG